jgi:hypothetical protein
MRSLLALPQGASEPDGGQQQQIGERRFAFALDAKSVTQRRGTYEDVVRKHALID